MSAHRILLVDDEDDIREVAQISLQLVANWEVLIAGSGKEAIRMARQEQPDAILLDCMMPDMDGFATYSGIQADETTRRIPVIMLTAKVQASDRKRFNDLGVNGVINKPFDPMRLSTDVATILGWA